MFGASLRRRRDPDQCSLAADTSNAPLLETRRGLRSAASLQSVGILDEADPGGQALEVVRWQILRCRLSNTVHVRCSIRCLYLVRGLNGSALLHGPVIFAKLWCLLLIFVMSARICLAAQRSRFAVHSCDSRFCWLAASVSLSFPRADPLELGSIPKCDAHITLGHRSPGRGAVSSDILRLGRERANF